MPRTRQNEQAALSKLRRISDVHELVAVAMEHPTRRNIRKLAACASHIASEMVVPQSPADELVFALMRRMHEIEDTEIANLLLFKLQDHLSAAAAVAATTLIHPHAEAAS